MTDPWDDLVYLTTYTIHPITTNQLFNCKQKYPPKNRARIYPMENGPMTDPWECSIFTLPDTNSSHLKMDGWNTIVSFWDGLSSGANCSFQGVYLHEYMNG